MRTWTFPATGGTLWDDLWEDEPWRDYALEADRAQDEAEEERQRAEQARLQAEAEHARQLAAEERRQARLARRRAAAAARRQAEREAKRRRRLAEIATQLAALAAIRLAEKERRLAEIAGKLAAELGTSTEYAAAYLERFGARPDPAAEQDAEPVEPIPDLPQRPVVADPASLIDNQFVAAERRRRLNLALNDRRLVRPQEGAA